MASNPIQLEIVGTAADRKPARALDVIRWIEGLGQDVRSVLHDVESFMATAPLRNRNDRELYDRVVALKNRLDGR